MIAAAPARNSQFFILIPFAKKTTPHLRGHCSIESGRRDCTGYLALPCLDNGKRLLAPWGIHRKFVSDDFAQDPCADWRHAGNLGIERVSLVGFDDLAIHLLAGVHIFDRDVGAKPHNLSRSAAG